MNLHATWDLLKQTGSGWSEDKLPRLSAALAYYTILSAAPLLAIVLAIAGWVFGPQAVEGKIVEQLQGLVGQEGGRAIQDMIKHAGESRASGPAVIIGVIMLLVGASGVFVELQDSLNTIW